MDLNELLGQIENIADLTDDELTELLADLRAAADERLDGDLTDDTLAELEQIAAATESVTTAQADRAQADADRAEKANALADRIRGEATADDEEEAAEASEGDDDAEADEDAEGDADGSDEQEATEGEGDTDTEVDATEAAPEKETVNAAPKPRITRVGARRPASMDPRPAKTGKQTQMSLVASANVPGVVAGSKLDSPDKIVAALDATIRATANYRGPRTTIPVMRLGADDPAELYGKERTLGRDAVVNDERIRKVTSPEAITAAGGKCAPSPVRYDFPTIGTDARPVRDGMMARFGADRGGVRLFPPVTLDQVDDGVGTWTNTTDTTPGEAVKPCLVMTCPSDQEEIVYAITRCIEIGNFRARFFAEQVDEWLTKLGQWTARYAESKLLTDIGAGSTQVTAATVLGTSTDVMTVLDRAVAGYISRHRADPGQRLRFAAPFWLLNQMRTDISRTAYGTAEERLAVADATIQSFFAIRNVNVSWFLDGESGQIFDDQADGALNGWPSSAVTYLYAEGDWLFLDGGSLDFGIVRDSTLNETNKFRIASETFEGSAFHGIESERIVIDTCPDGSTSAPVDINPCAGGS